jgi:hypothetical protein
VVVELGVRVTEGGDTTGVTDGGDVAVFDPQAAATSMTPDTTGPSVKRNRVGLGVETTTT